MRTFLLTTLLAGLALPAAADEIKIASDITQFPTWTTTEKSGGVPLTAAGVPGIPYNGYQTIDMPFSDNDGYWVAKYSFTLPANADISTARLKVEAFGADDRVVLFLNGVTLASGGFRTPGHGEMQLNDPGKLAPWNFPIAQAAGFHRSRGFVAGTNLLTFVVNNTYTGIFGPITGAGPTWVLLYGRVLYDTVPEGAAKPSNGR